jgi:hypothetical protein
MGEARWLAYGAVVAGNKGEEDGVHGRPHRKRETNVRETMNEHQFTKRKA